MAFSDRDYNRYDPHENRSLRSGMSVTMQIVLLNVILWLANGFLFTDNYLSFILSLHPSTINQPEYWWRFLTYGFVHDPFSLWHIGANMLSLIIFGYGLMLGAGYGGFGVVRSDSVENYLGRLEYLVFYLTTIFLGGVVFAFTNTNNTIAMGASGGVTGIVILYAWLFPNKVLYLYGIIPLPMWMLGAVVVLMDAMGEFGSGAPGIAYTIHLAGAAFATVYYFLFLKRGVRLTDNYYISLLSTRKKNKPPKPFKPKFTIFTVDEEKSGETEYSGSEAEFDRRLDEILGKYGQVGEAGLTRQEREFLQNASKKYREKYHR